MLRPLMGMLALLALAGALPITNVQLASNEGGSFLSFDYQPTSAADSFTIVPEEMQALSGGQFTLSSNLTINANLTAITYLFEIDRTANESLFSASVNVWCGSSSDDCGNCNGMAPGTYEWCNGAYPLRTYWCDHWCYTYSPSPAYEKARVGAFSKQEASADIAVMKQPEAYLHLDGAYSLQSSGPLEAELFFPPPNPSVQNTPLIRAYGSETWRAPKTTDLQSYGGSLISYYSQYLSSIGGAHSSSNNLNSALSALASNSDGEYTLFFESAPISNQFPSVKIILQAEYAGVIPLHGIPLALSLGSEPFFEGTGAYYEFEVQNLASIPDSFYANLSCNGTFLSSSNAFIPENSTSILKFFIDWMEYPALCTATAFLESRPSISSSITNTLDPFKPPCPSEFQCCGGSGPYVEWPCVDEEKFMQEDPYGNGYFYLQHYSCSENLCGEASTELIRRVTGNSPPPQQSYSPPQYNPPQQSFASAPTPTSSTISSPLASPSIQPSTLASPSPTHIPIDEEVVEIFAPDKITKGYAPVSVTANSQPAQGSILVLSPSMKRRNLPLELGSTEVLFNEEGEWKISYSFEYKKIMVIAAPGSLAPEESNLPSAQTSFLALNFSKLPLPQAALMFSLLAIGFALYRKNAERILFRKSFENNIVRLEIINNKTDLKNLEITDIAPEGTILSTISNPPSEVTEIIFGKHIKWKKNDLRKGERMLISYSIFTSNPSGSLRPAEILADSNGNKRIRVLSNPVAV
ncbi:MAG: hypothetical protein ABH863_00600 [Candidatus Micrarchaeota archaeon]